MTLYRLKSALIILIQLSFILANTAVGQKSRPRRKPVETTSVNKSLTPRQIAEKVLPSLVVVVTQDNQGDAIVQGSGFVYKQGLVATNLHVFKRASSAFVRLAGGNVNYKVTEVVGIDVQHDLCLVRIADSSVPPLTINVLNGVSMGDEVFAFGNPKGLEGSVSKGIVSSVRSDIGLIQIDAAISPGSSGGPVVNNRAQVIGIAVSSFISGQNLNFAIPTKFLANVKEQFAGLVPDAGAASVSDKENEHLEGPVKSYITTVAPFEYDDRLNKYIEQPRQNIGKRVFDQFGNLIEEWTYNYGDLAWKYFYSYDENGYLLGQIWEPVDGKRESFQFTTAQSRNRKMSSINLIGTFENAQGKWVYDQLGNNIETISKLIGTHSITSYNRKGLELELKYYVDGVLTQGNQKSYEFDENGNWIKVSNLHYDSRFPSLGYRQNSILYREISYFHQ
ncbi:MAG TPA: S1C family serine protease [Pyrinomonadaceae bacterium]|jgi:S1-C subfamily serine protease|nr:S1C family serine protease [Pyrinomonadaceae bacterium]